MSKFHVYYYFDNEFRVLRIVEVETLQQAKAYSLDTDMIEFSDSNNIYHRFNMKDVRLVKINEIN